MKKIINLLLLVPILALTTGCNDDELIFDHERPQFEIRENAILLEVIMPQGSSATDTYYIVGDFNGGEDEAVGNATWQLQKAPNNDIKWGIYLVPETFKNGKDLSDGYYFYSVAQGAERSINNEAVRHVLDNARVGTRTNVWVDRWAAFFEGGGGEEKDHYTIYVDDQTGWETPITHLYAWNEDVGGDVSPGWPGWEVTGTETIGGYTFLCFELAKDYNNAVMNLIFNNNGKNQVDGPQGYINNRDLYLTVTGNGFVEIDPGDLGEGPYNGYTIYAEDATGWTSLSLYAYGDKESALWPGWEMAGTTEIRGVTYKYFRPGEDYNNLNLSLIFNNNATEGEGSAARAQIDGPTVLLDKDYYFKVTTTTVTEVDPFAVEPVVRTIYVEDNTGGWDLYMYFHPDGGFTSWPGMQPDGVTTIGGITYKYFELDGTLNLTTINLIFSDNGDSNTQLSDYEAYLDKDYYLEVSTAGVVEKSFRVYADDQTGWSSLALYGWGSVNTEAWPGIQSGGTETINGVVYDYFDLPAEISGRDLNLIFNSNVALGAIQNPDVNIMVNRDYYFQVIDGISTEVAP